LINRGSADVPGDVLGRPRGHHPLVDGARVGYPGLPAQAAPAATPAEVDEAGYAALTEAVRGLLRLDLSKYKRPQVWRRVVTFSTARGFVDVGTMLAGCRLDPTLREAFRDMLTINVSEFFRNPDAWAVLQARFLPSIVSAGRGPGSTPIRVWSAGCSFGYEPYSLAMQLLEGRAPIRTEILATDVDEPILARARASCYDERQMAGVSAARRERFFREAAGTWVARPELQRLVTWRVHDLLRDPVPGRFDLIACRNVSIYFTDAAKTELYRSFADSLDPDGILFVGATESIPAAARVGLMSMAPGFYRRIA
jgi:chemotaxis protein methyltransferase CheR